jgi:hypothetical protein
MKIAKDEEGLVEDLDAAELCTTECIIKVRQWLGANCQAVPEFVPLVLVEIGSHHRYSISTHRVIRSQRCDPISPRRIRRNCGTA